MMLIAALTGTLIAKAQSVSRTWTSLDGRTVDAELVSRTSTTLTLRRSSDKAQFTLPVDKLSAEDKAWISTLPAPTEPLHPLMITLQVAVEQRDSRGTDWKTTYGSYSKSAAFFRTLVITAKTTQADFDPVVEFKYAFIGYDEGTRKTAAYDSGIIKGHIGRGAGETTSIQSTVQTSEDTNYAALDERYRTGVKPRGWVIVLRQGDKEIKWHASDEAHIRWLKAEIEAKRFDFSTEQTAGETTRATRAAKPPASN